MTLTSYSQLLLRQIDNPDLDRKERVALRCKLAKELEDSGSYEAARAAMGDIWQRIGERPNLEGLDRATIGEVLLRTGALTGWIGSAKQLGTAQATAKDLISESVGIFDELQETDKLAEAYIDLAIC